MRHAEKDQLNHETHHLKILPKYWPDLEANLRTFEIRKQDRDYKIGDRLVLREWDPETEKFTGRETWRDITYIFQGGQLGLAEGYIAMGIA